MFSEVASGCFQDGAFKAIEVAIAHHADAGICCRLLKTLSKLAQPLE